MKIGGKSPFLHRYVGAVRVVRYDPSMSPSFLLGLLCLLGVVLIWVLSSIAYQVRRSCCPKLSCVP